MNQTQISRNDYLKLIDIVTGESANPLAIWMAKTHPEILLDFHEFGDYTKYATVIVHLKANQRIAAIKELRNVEGLGLLEAKRCIDFSSPVNGEYHPEATEEVLSILGVLRIGEILRRAYTRGF